ncbi:hypothetical protein AVEN_115851-1, partial [Araneus ventricosus]
MGGNLKQKVDSNSMRRLSQIVPYPGPSNEGLRHGVLQDCSGKQGSSMCPTRSSRRG